MSHIALAIHEEQSQPPTLLAEPSPPVVTFHPATPEHYPAIAGLVPNRRELFRAHPTAKFPLTTEQVAEMVDKRLNPTVMVVDGVVAGFACFYRYRPEKSVFIGHVMIHPQMRRQGLGRELVKHMVYLAFDQYQVPEVRVSILAQNTPALLGCVRGGFRPYAVLERKNRRGEPLALLNLRIHRDRLVRPREENTLPAASQGSAGAV